MFIAVLIALAAVWTPGRAQARPQRVWIGMYVVNLLDFELKSSAYTGDFYLWVRSDGEIDGTGFEIMNGAGDPCTKLMQTARGRVQYHQYRCQYRLHTHLDVSAYPLDRHQLTIEIEDKTLPIADLVYAPDREFSGVDPAIRLPGWEIGSPTMRVVTHHYSSLGDPAMEPGSDAPYSRLIMAIPIRRAGSATYLKSFLVMFLSVGIGLLGSAVSAGEIEARLGVGVASIFGVVSSYLMVADALPETAQFTLADQLHLVAMGSVFVSILISVTVYRVNGRDGEARAERLDRWLGWGTTICFIAAAAAVSALH